MADRFIAVDWGTTNRRAYLIEGGAVLETERDGKGVTALARDAYPAEIAGLRARWGELPVLLAGMVGSTIGWQDAAYVPAPTGLQDLAGALLRVDADTAIVPGVSLTQGRRADVMRGEEVQLLGACAAGLAPSDALLVQPGTHAKWAEMADGRIARFTTAMTGELFALIGRHSILAPQLTGAVAVGDAFREGVSNARDGDLLTRLFGVRAAKLLGLRDDADAASYLSGLLIGTDVAARLAAGERQEVYLLADPMLGALYATAIEANGAAARLINSHAAFVAGITRLWELAR